MLMSETLFDKYGGFETFTKVVTNFYKKVLDNEQVEHYFNGVNIDRLIAHQTNFISTALGGPDRYQGKDIKAVHAPLKITLPDFSEVAELLEESLEDGGVSEEDIETILAIVSSLQDQIVSN